MTHHGGAPLTPSPGLPPGLPAGLPPGLPAATPPAATARGARLLASPAGTCASEVALNAGMAVVFFSALCLTGPPADTLTVT
ncbi:hypothetical protein E1212_25765 [Jiangella ureilytica]|uniref:Uncharacterized protein n=1 Tax=Jiangella ureilytica TaxID=2530374 RepID=A0A4R4RCN0_9ACTN|nr:hypothetical protein [Jiangella ureilytica]TDC46907.1 hypothetical protein E1212_25765 [Jiangella ureilytica]